MSDIEITLTIPEDLAKDAQEFDALNAETMIKALRTEVDRRIMDFVNGEIKDYRAEKSADRGKHISKRE